VHLLGVAPDSHIKSPQELIRESNFAITPNVDSFFSLDLRTRDQIYFIYHYFPLLKIDEIELSLPLG
jgi:hypothetical protein